MTVWRRVAAVLALAAMLGQAGIMLAVSPVVAFDPGGDAAGGPTYVVICTGHGVETILLEDEEGPGPSRSAPDPGDLSSRCPMCLMVSHGPAAVLAPAAALAVAYERTEVASAKASDIPIDPVTLARYGRAPPLHA